MRVNLRWVVLAVLGLSACSSDAGVDLTNARSDGEDGAASAGDGGGDGSSVLGPAPDLASPPSYDGFGSVFVFLNRIAVSGTPYDSTTVGATFYQAATGAGGGSCTSKTIDPCVVTQCTGTGAGTTPHQAAAGEVTVSGPGKEVTLHTAFDSHETQSTSALWWHGGDALSISSTGATVAAFADSLTLPEQIVVSAPYLPQQGAVAITRSLGLSLSWQGGIHGDAVFTLAGGGIGASTSAVCRYPAAQGAAVLPATVLSQFPAGVASFSGATHSEHARPVGSWLVTSSASFNAVYDTGRTVAGQLELD